MNKLFLLSVLAVCGGAFTGEHELAFPLWDGKESVAEYAKRVGLEPTLTLDLVSNVKLELALIPAGSFTMGSPESEEGRRHDRELDESSIKLSERQQKIVISHPFYMGKHEVTQAQYARIVGRNPTGRHETVPSPELPVTNVSWMDCQGFCEKLTAKAGKTARLPTEAEWEYACRAGTTTPFYTGATILPDQANYFCSKPYGKEGKVGRPFGRVRAGGSYLPNPWGLCDMIGNVDEWCLDITPLDVPPGSLDPIGEGNIAAVRGGAWGCIPEWSRSAWRCGTYKVGDYGGNNTGFRIVVTIAKPKTGARPK